MATNIDSLEVYQLRVWLKGISPLIWRRFLIRSDSTIKDLHCCLQIIMGWKNIHLHQFKIQGKSYGISYIGGIGFRDNPGQVHLKDFQFRLTERFSYEYNLSAFWEHEIRVEKKLTLNVKKRYPICIGGNLAAPKEDCYGPEAFMALEDYYTPWQIEENLLELIERYVEEDIDLPYVEDNLRVLRYWANRHQFKRRPINRQLQQYAAGEDIDEILEGGRR